MVKHSQTIRPQKLANCLSVFDHYVGLALKGLTYFRPASPFYFPENITLSDFLAFSGGKEREHWLEVG